jgi:hypothetical protein
MRTPSLHIVLKIKIFKGLNFISANNFTARNPFFTFVNVIHFGLKQICTVKQNNYGTNHQILPKFKFQNSDNVLCRWTLFLYVHQFSAGREL